MKGTQEGGHPKLDCLTEGIEKETDNLRDNFDTEEIMNELEKAVKEIGYE